MEHGWQPKDCERLNIFTSSSNRISSFRHTIYSLPQSTHTMEALQVAVNHLTARVDALEVENADLKKENAELKLEMAVLKSENAELKKENAELKLEMVQLKKQNSELRKENAELKKENSELKARLVRQEGTIVGKMYARNQAVPIEDSKCDSEECSICLHASPNLQLTKCKHDFHAGCLISWFGCCSRTFTCPICRSRVF